MPRDLIEQDIWGFYDTRKLYKSHFCDKDLLKVRRYLRGRSICLTMSNMKAQDDHGIPPPAPPPASIPPPQRGVTGPWAGVASQPSEWTSYMGNCQSPPQGVWQLHHGPPMSPPLNKWYQTGQPHHGPPVFPSLNNWYQTGQPHHQPPTVTVTRLNQMMSPILSVAGSLSYIAWLIRTLDYFVVQR